MITILRQSRTELRQIFVKMLNNSGYLVRDLPDDDEVNPIKYVVTKSGDPITLHIYLKNVTLAGWADKPHIFRVQVTNCFSSSNISKITSTEITIICGICSVDDIPMLCAWNVFGYVLHKTNRSCYVLSTSLILAKERGFYMSHDLGQFVWICRSDFIETLLSEYVKMTYIEEIA